MQYLLKLGQNMLQNYIKYTLILVILVSITLVIFKKFLINTRQEKFIIIGASAAGIAAADYLLTHKCAGSVLVVSQENVMPYNKCDLDSIIDNSATLQDITIAPSSITSKHLLLGKKVISIDRANKQILCDDTSSIAYTKLLIATGAYSKDIPIPGALLAQGFFTFNSYTDAQAIKSYCTKNNYKNAVIIGTGFTGLELAQALHEIDIQCLLITTSDRLLASCLNEPASMLLQNAAENMGVIIFKNTHVKAQENNKGLLTKLILSDDRVVEVPVCIWAGGLFANSDIAKNAGLHVHKDGTIMVTKTMQTSDQNIYAAGDVAAVINLTNGKIMRSTKWGAAKSQAKVAAANMCNGDGVTEYPGLIPSVSSNFFGYKVFAAGSAFDGESRQVEQTIIKNVDDRYCQVFYQNTAVTGLIIVAPVSYKAIIMQLREAFANKNLSEIIALMKHF